MVPYEVGVDGFGMSTFRRPACPASRSRSPRPELQPLVDAGGTIWQLNGGTWVTLVRGAGPLPGTAPFYPL